MYTIDERTSYKAEKDEALLLLLQFRVLRAQVGAVCVMQSCGQKGYCEI